MSININSEAACRKAYLNYHCYGNTMGVSAAEMGEITAKWSNRLSSWQTTVSKDENQYEFDDSDYSQYKNNGKKDAQEKTGHDGSKGGMVARGVADGIAGAAGGVLSSGIANNALQGVAGAVGSNLTKATTNVASKLGSQSAKGLVGSGKEAVNGTTNAAGGASKASWIIGAPLALATGIAYKANKPNKDEKEACDALQNEMLNAQAALSETQAEMEDMANQLIELSDEAHAANEQANTEIKEDKTEFDMYKASYEALKAKAESGQPLSEEEKALYQALTDAMAEKGENINSAQAETTDVVGEIYDDMGTYQDGYDYAAESMGEIEGLTDFAEGFDSATKTMCYVEAGAQTLNAASGAKAMLQAGQFAASGGIFTSWALAFAAMGGTGAALSGIGAAEQFKWAGEVGTEIDMRKDTQTFNVETMDIYTEEIDAYDGFMTGIEDLEINMPNDIEVPEAAPLPVTDAGKYPAGTPDDIKTDKTKEEK